MNNIKFPPGDETCCCGVISGAAGSSLPFVDNVVNATMDAWQGAAELGNNDCLATLGEFVVLDASLLDHLPQTDVGQSICFGALFAVAGMVMWVAKANFCPTGSQLQKELKKQA
jgi:hypothetical protein